MPIETTELCSQILLLVSNKHELRTVCSHDDIANCVQERLVFVLDNSGLFNMACTKICAI